MHIRTVTKVAYAHAVTDMEWERSWTALFSFILASIYLPRKF